MSWRACRKTWNSGHLVSGDSRRLPGSQSAHGVVVPRGITRLKEFPKCNDEMDRGREEGLLSLFAGLTASLISAAVEEVRATDKAMKHRREQCARSNGTMTWSDISGHGDDLGVLHRETCQRKSTRCLRQVSAEGSHLWVLRYHCNIIQSASNMNELHCQYRCHVHLTSFRTSCPWPRPVAALCCRCLLLRWTTWVSSKGEASLGESQSFSGV